MEVVGDGEVLREVQRSTLASYRPNAPLRRIALAGSLRGRRGDQELALGQAKMQRRTDGGGFEIGPFRQKAAASDLCAAGRTHSNAEFTPRALVETMDDGGPVPGFEHVNVSGVKEDRGLAQSSSCCLTDRALSCGYGAAESRRDTQGPGRKATRF